MRNRTLLLFVLLTSFAKADDSGWQWSLRGACLLDSEQSTAAMTCNRWVRAPSGQVNLGPVREVNPLYRGMSDWERGPAVLAIGYGVERLITVIHDPKWRQVAGWLAVAVESFVVVGNQRSGVPLFGFRF